MTFTSARDTITLAGERTSVVLLERIDTRVRLPFSLKVLLENVVRTHDGHHVTDDHVRALADWDPLATPSAEIPFTPARVLMQDFTGVPAIVDLATLREAVGALGGDPTRVNPLAPAELVIDHSVIADAFGTARAIDINVDLEYERNRERYQFLRWGQQAFDEFRVVPPGTGIVHQVNVEHLARVVMSRDGWCYPDTVVGTDSHTTMVNGLGVLGWGVGGIEAEAAMLGQPVSMLVPRVVGFRLTGRLPAAATATDLVLTITEMLRRHGVVGALVEFFGEGCAEVSLANRATIGNMSPEYGSTAATFPIDDRTLDYLRLTGRSAQQCERVEQYARRNGLWLDPQASPDFSERLELDLATVEPSLAGPRRPQDRIALRSAQQAFHRDLPGFTDTPARAVPVSLPGVADLRHGAVVIAAITSCTNTSNPEVMVAAGLLARNAVERGLRRQPWVKTTLAPGSQVVTDYLDAAGLTPYLCALGFDLVGYGCTTCIGNSGPLIPEVSAAVTAGDLAVSAVLSGNRNFEGRINAEVSMNYLASPPLVVAYALAGTMDIDLLTDPLGTDADGDPVRLTEIWPDPAEVAAVIADTIEPSMFTRRYADVFRGDDRWRELPTPSSATFIWDQASTYVRRPPYFDGMTPTPPAVTDIAGARVLAVLGDSVTTDHISPAGSIKVDSPAGRYLIEHGVSPADFNSYGSRRGNHEVMIRGTFANTRLRNALVPGVQGGVTRNLLTGRTEAIYDAAVAYRAAAVPLVILAGEEYGSGSSRDWAAKGTRLLGVRAVLASSFERIHRSNLVGMGVLPLELPAGETAASMGLTGEEVIDITGITALDAGTPTQVTVRASGSAGVLEFTARVRIDTPGEAMYYRHGGILPFMARRLAGLV
ncbi:MAG: aconitate hydratase AcnA [Actinomycetales bacterium]|nr:aconitate hydratase AcnA [Actinomycetales bacterium]